MAEHSISEFVKMLKNLSDSQSSIQSLSTWCLEHHMYYKSIINIWLEAIMKETVKKRLILFYLANHVIQYSKKNKYKFDSRWKTPIQKAIPYVRDENILFKISRILKIWEERRIYDVSYLTDLKRSLTKNIQKLKSTNPVQEIQMNNNNKCSTYTTNSYEAYKHTPTSSSHQFITSKFSINVGPTNLSSLVNKNTMPACYVPQTAWDVTSDRTINDPPPSPFLQEKISYQNTHIIGKTNGEPRIDYCVLPSKIKDKDETVSPETRIKTSSIDHSNLNSFTYPSDMNLLTGNIDVDWQALSGIPMPPPSPPNLRIEIFSSPLKDDEDCFDMDLSDNDRKYHTFFQPPRPPTLFYKQISPGIRYRWVQPSKPCSNGEHNFNENKWNTKEFDQREHLNQFEEDRRFSKLVHNQIESVWLQDIHRIQSRKNFGPKWKRRISIVEPKDPSLEK